jgi:hypothetical protein
VSPIQLCCLLRNLLQNGVSDIQLIDHVAVNPTKFAGAAVFSIDA